MNSMFINKISKYLTYFSFIVLISTEISAQPWEGEVMSVRYKTTKNVDLVMDLYFPYEFDDELLPAYVFVHGGSIPGRTSKTNRSAMFPTNRGVFERLQENKLIGVSINYRTKADKFTIDEMIANVQDAIRYLRREYYDLFIKPDKISIWGESSGAYIALMAALAPPDIFPGDPNLKGEIPKVNGVVWWYGITDLRPKEDLGWGWKEFAQLIGKPDEKEKVLQTLISKYDASRYLSKDSPKILMMMGENDILPRPKEFEEKAKIKNVRIEYITIKNATQSWRVQYGKKELTPSLNLVHDKTAAFLISCSQ